MCRKIVCLILLISMCFTLNVNADVTVKSSEDNILTLSGTSSVDGEVFVMVINPGYTMAEALSNSEEALHFYGKTNAVDSVYSLDITLNETRAYNKEFYMQGVVPCGGTYTFVVSDTVSTEQFEYSYYYVSEKLNLLKKLSAMADGELANEMEYVFNLFSLDTEKLYSNTPVEMIASAVTKFRGEDGEFVNDPDTFYTQLKDALYIAAFNNGTSELFSDEKLDCENMSFLSEASVDDYLKNLSPEGVRAVDTSVIGQDLGSLKEISDAFETAVALNLIVNNEEMGYGHVEECISKYVSIFKAAGIDVDKIRKSDQANLICSKMAGSNAKDMNELYSVYQKAMKSAKGDSSSGSSGSGSGGGFSVVGLGGISSGTSNDSVYIAPDVKPQPDALPFVDMQNHQWAEEAVLALSQKGVINGRGNGLFDPSSHITRAEFSKMLCVAFLGDPTEKQCPFVDVSGWSLPYVAQCSQAGVVNGITDSLFMPDDDITREQAATMVIRAINLKKVLDSVQYEPFTDHDSISSWAVGGVYALKSTNILLGRDNNNFYPQEFLTRAEAAKMIYMSLGLIGGADFEK